MGNIQYNITGIYSIFNKRNGKRYIGRAIDIKRRFIGHHMALDKGYHGNKYLQSEWDLYGEGSFEFEILERCDEKQLDELERKYITLYSSTIDKHGYNVMLGGLDGKKLKLPKDPKTPLREYGYNEIFLDDSLNSKYMKTKLVKEDSNHGYLYLPKDWIGKKVRVLLLEDTD